MDYLTRFVGSRTPLPTRKWGILTVESASFTPAIDGDLVVEVGKIDVDDEIMLRIHSECTFAQIFGSTLCDCDEQLDLAMQRLKQHGSGILVYLRFDGRGAGLAAKVKATALEVAGITTHESRCIIGVPPEGRDFSSIGKYLKKRGISRIRCLTNNPLKISGLVSSGLHVVSEPLLVPNPSSEVKQLYRTKQEKFGHLIPPSIFK